MSILARPDRPREVVANRAIPSIGERLAVRHAVTPAFGRVAVLGLGQIGGSLMHAIRDSGLDVVGYDVDRGGAAAASASGFPVTSTDAGAVHGADLVILAMPLPQVRAALTSLAPYLAPDALLTDVGTLKAPVLAAVRELLPRANFVGGHPLAGIEQSGWAAADPLLFRDAPWTLTIEPGTDLDAWLRLAELVCDLGAKPVPSTAAEQDAAVARVIGLPHVLAEALALTGLAGGPLGLSLAAGSYLSGSRVARTRPDLVATWCDGNPPLVTALDDVIARLVSARDELAAARSVLDLAEAGHTARINWEHRRFEPVELPAAFGELCAHGRDGGWITAVLRDADGVRLLGMRPSD
ncbi:MAG: prephenate dehydrogenase [Pseudonocardiales bacterium]|nr:MAG: prephenate dehydrogenase [Pseudonocardiales bacterium]